MSARIAMAALCCASMAGPALGAVLYKSVGADGVVQFSDLPPEKAAGVQRIEMRDSSSASTGNPIIVSGASSEEQLRAADEAVQRASAQVDLAEHALATARRPIWSEPRLMQISEPRRTRSDEERIDFYKKNVVIARAQLLDVLREKRKADARNTMTASNVSSTDWVPLR
jgi:acyl-CoA synthetase (NDP forming)